MKNIVLLGCTGSIGNQTLDILSRFPEKFHLAGVSARGSNPDRLLKIISDFQPEYMVITDENIANRVSVDAVDFSTRILTGTESHIQLAGGELTDVDIVVSALSGTAGLRPTLASVEAGLDIALANKETLVTAGEFVVALARKTGSRFYPVDSEHSAIYQCLAKINRDDLRRLILTCSGGPFSNKPDIDLSKITPKQALAHPTWNMGRKISIDSATLMNKGLEIIEACWLFNVPQDMVDVVIHPQSIIHSMIESKDGSVMAQMSKPDMRHPILFALSGDRHWETDLPRIDFSLLGELTFTLPDTKRFPCLALAREAMKTGGTMTAVLNKANEVAVDGFCAGEIGFMDIPRVIENAMEAHNVLKVDSLDSITLSEEWTRRFIGEKWGI